MKAFLKKFFIPIFISILFLSLMVGNYTTNRNLLKNALVNEQISIIKSASKRISSWLNNKILSLEAINFIIQDFDHTKDLKNINDVIKKSQSIANFSSIYGGYQDGTTISSRAWIKPPNYEVTKRPWYKNAIEANTTIIVNPYIDAGLNIPVVSLCSPIWHKEMSKGVLCGILSLNYIKNEILDITLTNNGTIFLVNMDGTILISKDLLQGLSKFEIPLPQELKDSKILNLVNDTYSAFYSYSKIKNSNWILVAKSQKKDVYHHLNEQFIINLSIYGVSIILFYILAYFYNSYQNQQNYKLRQLKRLLQLFINSTQRGTLVQNSVNEIVFYNKELIAQLGLTSAKELKFDDIARIMPFPDFNRLKFWLTNSTANKIQFETNFETNGKFFNFQALSFYAEDGNLEGTICFCIDITKSEINKKIKQEQDNILVQQSKMADLGVMIGAISHQWRQPLNTLSLLLGNLLQFKMLGKLDDKIFEMNLKKSLNHIDYLAKTMDTFKNFYKPKHEKQLFDIKEAIDDTVFIILPKLGGIKFKIYIQNGIDTKFNGYLNEFQQVLACLLQNAKDALYQAHKNNKKIIITIRKNENFIEIRVCDNGIGINPHIELFEPFSSSKGNLGTGNGLYISKLIAKNKFKGELSVKSRKKPTTFSLKIPLGEFDA